MRPLYRDIHRDMCTVRSNPVTFNNFKIQNKQFLTKMRPLYRDMHRDMCTVRSNPVISDLLGTKTQSVLYKF